MRLHRVPDADARERALRGELDGMAAAPGWPHEDTRPGMGFLDSGGLVFLVIDDAGRIAGECGTKTPPDRNGAVEIGYGLAGPSRARGLGTAAVRELLAVVPELVPVRRYEAEVHLSNEPSRRLLERLGFRETGPVRAGHTRYARDVMS